VAAHTKSVQRESFYTLDITWDTGAHLSWGLVQLLRRADQPELLGASCIARISRPKAPI